MYYLNPYRGTNLLQNFDHLFDNMEQRFSGSTGSFHTDISGNGKEYLLEADLPGVKKEDLQIDLNDGYLTIRAERHSDFEEKDKAGNYVRCERSYGSFSRSFETAGIDADHITAKFDSGVLTLHMPKLEQTQPSGRRLEIE
ncbi:MAG: Hsp20/alpha crystallin family protein [Oscillospiraceae bacterium]|nr:Hsp20/alpha crystallin family protein [Oscillospiraceae bacterium]